MKAQIDKSLVTALSDGYGTIIIRVVVLERKAATPQKSDTPLDADPDEPALDTDKSPLASYLETPKRGKYCCVFLVNGQRQHAWDNTFIVRDLDLKYLRKRTFVVVDVDGLRDEAIAALMQGTRHGFYEGKEYDALASRVIATLRGDPDLLRLEAEAEEEISSLRTGDEAVKKALDQLIEDHHDQAMRTQLGERQPGAELQGTTAEGDFPHDQSAVVEADSTLGRPSGDPVLLMQPDVMTLRLKPNQLRGLELVSRPDSEWHNLEELLVETDPPVKELAIAKSIHSTSASVDLKFDEPEGFEEDQYPIETTLRVLATFKNHPEPRLVSRRIIINRPRKRKPRPQPVLRDDPTFIRVTSHQPIKFNLDGSDLHVKLKWDGKDSLVQGDPAPWTFTAVCRTGASPVSMTFTEPRGGRFELLIQPPPDMNIGDKFEFTLEVGGPEEKTLTTSFSAFVPEPREITTTTPGGTQRRPPYNLKYVTKEQWDTDSFWEGNTWSQDDAGCFSTPTKTTPLTLMINQDMGLLASYRDSLIERKLVESTITERTTRYSSHVAFHLYQMYMNMKDRIEMASEDSGEDETEVPKDEDMKQEINRVGVTLLKLMELSR